MDDGTAVPLTLPVALTWGNKFPIARDPALFLLLPSKPEGPPLKKWQGVGWGQNPKHSCNWLWEGEIFSSLTSYFKFCLCKVWALFFLFLFFKGNEMEFEGNASLIPLLHVLPGACPRASASSSVNSRKVLSAVPGLWWWHKAAAETNTGCSDFSLSGDSRAPRMLHTSSSRKSHFSFFFRDHRSQWFFFSLCKQAVPLLIALWRLT